MHHCPTCEHLTDMNRVQLTRETIEVLGNFVQINPSIIVCAGSEIRSISNLEHILAKYKCTEVFPIEFAIYDLSEFLNVVSLFEQPVLEFDNDQYVTIRSGSKYSKYYFSNPEITLKRAPNTDVKFPGADIQFALTETDIKGIRKASNILDLEDINIKSDGDIRVSLIDPDDETNNTYEQVFQGDATGDFSVNIKMENLVVLSGDYTLRICAKGMSEWQDNNRDLVYYIGLEQ